MISVSDASSPAGAARLRTSSIHARSSAVSTVRRRSGRRSASGACGRNAWKIWRDVLPVVRVAGLSKRLVERRRPHRLDRRANGQSRFHHVIGTARRDCIDHSRGRLDVDRRVVSGGPDEEPGIEVIDHQAKTLKHIVFGAAKDADAQVPGQVGERVVGRRHARRQEDRPDTGSQQSHDAVLDQRPSGEWCQDLPWQPTRPHPGLEDDRNVANAHATSLMRRALVARSVNRETLAASTKKDDS